MRDFVLFFSLVCLLCILCSFCNYVAVNVWKNEGVGGNSHQWHEYNIIKYNFNFFFHNCAGLNNWYLIHCKCVTISYFVPRFGPNPESLPICPELCPADLEDGWSRRPRILSRCKDCQLDILNTIDPSLKTGKEKSIVNFKGCGLFYQLNLILVDVSTERSMAKCTYEPNVTVAKSDLLGGSMWCL